MNRTRVGLRPNEMDQNKFLLRPMLSHAFFVDISLSLSLTKVQSIVFCTNCRSVVAKNDRGKRRRAVQRYLQEDTVSSSLRSCPHAESRLLRGLRREFRRYRHSWLRHGESTAEQCNRNSRGLKLFNSC